MAGVGAFQLGPLRIDLALDLDLLLLDGGAVAGPQVDDDGLGIFTSTNAELLGWLGLTDDPALDCEWREGEVAADLRHLRWQDALVVLTVSPKSSVREITPGRH